MYIDGQQYATSEEYYDQSVSIATSLPEITEEQAEKIEWLPLGVFALSDESGESNRVIQLAVSKEGVITGSYYNEDTDVSRPIEGTVDKATQRAAWSFADEEDTEIVMETMIYNLTEDKTTVLVHFGPDQTQEWTLTRLEEPEDAPE